MTYNNICFALRPTSQIALIMTAVFLFGCSQNAHGESNNVVPLFTSTAPPPTKADLQIEQEAIIANVERTIISVRHTTGLSLPDARSLRSFCSSPSTSLLQCEKRAVDTNRYLLRLIDQHNRARQRDKKLNIELEKLRLSHREKSRQRPQSTAPSKVPKKRSTRRS